MCNKFRRHVRVKECHETEMSCIYEIREGIRQLVGQFLNGLLTSESRVFHFCYHLLIKHDEDGNHFFFLSLISLLHRFEYVCGKMFYD